MSIDTVARVISEGVSQSQLAARLVLIAIADHLHDDGFGYAKTKYLAEKANVDRTTAWRKVAELIDLGEVRCFTRGHYEAPAYVLNIVANPLTSEQIAERLQSLDNKALWKERIPGEQGLPFTRLQDATISERDGEWLADPPSQASDQDFQGLEERENPPKDDPGEIDAIRNGPLRTATITRDPPVAHRDDPVADRNGSLQSRNVVQNLEEESLLPPPPRVYPGSGGGGEAAPIAEQLAIRWCELTGRPSTPQVVAAYTRQVEEHLRHHSPPDDAFLRTAAAEGIKHPAGWAWLPQPDQSQSAHTQNLIEQCPTCDDGGMVWYTADNQPTRGDDIEAVAGNRCTHPDLAEANG